MDIKFSDFEDHDRGRQLTEVKMDIVERLRALGTNMGSFGSIEREAADEIERLREALQSIANNTCCEGCQEAALVARAALREGE